MIPATQAAQAARRYRLTFNGRRTGAIGITYRQIAEVEAPDVGAALLKLYDTHEHVSLIKTEVIP